MEEQWKEELGQDSDAIPGLRLAPGAHVRELGDNHALEVWHSFKQARAAGMCRFSLEDLLAASRVGLTALETKVAETEGIDSARARALVNRILERLISVRQNKPSLKRMTRAEELEQQERLTERGEE